MDQNAPTRYVTSSSLISPGYQRPSGGPGTQRIDLGQPVDYTPRRKLVTVSGVESRSAIIRFSPSA